MKVSEVTEQDLRHLHHLSTILNSGEYSVGGKDFVKSGDAVRWFHSFIQEMANAFAQKTSDKPAGAPVAPAAPVTSEPPLPGLGDTKIKAFHPGKPSKK